jgi:hypothetical protein
MNFSRDYQIDPANSYNYTEDLVKIKFGIQMYRVITCQCHVKITDTEIQSDSYTNGHE